MAPGHLLPFILQFAIRLRSSQFLLFVFVIIKLPFIMFWSLDSTQYVPFIMFQSPVVLSKCPLSRLGPCSTQCSALMVWSPVAHSVPYHVFGPTQYKCPLPRFHPMIVLSMCPLLCFSPLQYSVNALYHVQSHVVLSALLSWFGPQQHIVSVP